MSCHKILTNTRNIFVRKTIPFKKNTGEIVTRSTAFCTPPRVRVSFVEKMALCSTISLSILVIPAWVLYNIPEYQGEKRA